MTTFVCPSVCEGSIRIAEGKDAAFQLIYSVDAADTPPNSRRGSGHNSDVLPGAAF
jgi:hypothetical protein